MTFTNRTRCSAPLCSARRALTHDRCRAAPGGGADDDLDDQRPGHRCAGAPVAGVAVVTATNVAHRPGRHDDHRRRRQLHARRAPSAPTTPSAPRSAARRSSASVVAAIGQSATLDLAPDAPAAAPPRPTPDDRWRDRRRHRPPPRRDQDQRSRDQRQPGADPLAAADRPQLPELRQARARASLTTTARPTRKSARAPRPRPAVNVFIDGTSIKNQILDSGIAGQENSRGNPFGQIAVQEFRVLTQNFKAEYEQAVGGGDHRRRPSRAPTNSMARRSANIPDEGLPSRTFSPSGATRTSPNSSASNMARRSAARSSRTSCSSSAPMKAMIRIARSTSLLGNRTPASHRAASASSKARSSARSAATFTLAS